jgi:hypothetical protein
MSRCKWRRGGSKKYVLTEVYEDTIPFNPPDTVHANYCTLDDDGYIIIDEGYEWDGASGPTIDTDDTMDGSLVHDILYQMMREGRLSRKYRKAADKCIKIMCIEDAHAAIGELKISKWRKWWRRKAATARFNYWYFFLRIGGGSSAR